MCQVHRIDPDTEANKTLLLENVIPKIWTSCSHQIFVLISIMYLVRFQLILGYQLVLSISGTYYNWELFSR